MLRYRLSPSDYHYYGLSNPVYNRSMHFRFVPGKHANAIELRNHVWCIICWLYRIIRQRETQKVCLICLKMSRMVPNCLIVEDSGKTFSKRILQPGIGDGQPAVGCEARVMISLIETDPSVNLDLGDYKQGVYADVLVGDGCSELAQLIDQVVQTMKEKEWCYVKTKVDIPGAKLQNKGSIQEMDQEYVGLKLNIRLQSFTSVPDLSGLDLSKKLELADEHKAKGNVHYNAGRIPQSRTRFLKALDYLNLPDLDSLSEDVRDKAKKLTSICHLNMALGYLKQRQFEKVVESCNVGLQIEPDNVKGLYRRSQAYVNLKRYSEAEADLSRALESEPTNTTVSRSLEFVKKKLHSV